MAKTKLGRFIEARGVTKEHLIEKTKINRNKFYLGLKYPAIFEESELKSIAEALGVSLAEIKKSK